MLTPRSSHTVLVRFNAGHAGDFSETICLLTVTLEHVARTDLLQYGRHSSFVPCMPCPFSVSLSSKRRKDAFDVNTAF
ncbi:hypothetical protein NDU88_006914 [Pleurodeles waltl]|uniref:Uncharacterized protein n=1 Tax=Pleurodeles waltl TaxID=8319 RepID=A0AAV7N2R9_PLEWA|nr:hypothetical protein NDU88_006914 [Pleurodeles waltl]